MSNPNFDAVLSTTLKNYVPKLEDNIFTARPLFFFLKSNNQVRLISGGQKIVLPLIYATNSTFGSYATTDTISTTAQTGISAAEYPWAQVAATVTINGLEESQNSGEAEIIDLLEGKIMQTEESIGEGLNTMFYGDGTGNSNKDMLGLKAIVGDATTTPTSVGGIDAATQAYWRSYVNATVTALTIGQMTTAYNTTAVGADQPNFIVTTQTLFEKYESLLQPQLRFSDNKTADGGFQNLVFKGAPVTYDVSCTAGYMYFLNSRYVRLVGHKDKWFTPTPFVRPINQDAKFAQILCYGNLCVSNRKRQGVLTGKS